MKNVEQISDELYFVTSRSGGKGGQNVNKTETKVTVFWNYRTSAVFTDEQKNRIGDKLKNRINENNEVWVSCQEHRTQLKNRIRSVEKLITLVSKALETDNERIATRASKASVAKGKKKKIRNSEIKKWRARVKDWE